MPRQRRENSDGKYYHIMIGGNERKAIFYVDEDRLNFIDILYGRKQGHRLLFLHAFCLMDNHIHMMMQEGT